MGRFQLIEREINKGIKIDEKSNEVITGWSPNNVRRLIIGFDFAVVRYFVKEGKYKELTKVLDLRRVAQKDIEQLQTDPRKYKSILQVLTDGRICSSVEEIIFCSQGYPEPLLQLDKDISKLTTGNASLENRFVRLRHVSVVASDVETIAKLSEESKGSTELIKDKLTEKGIPSVELVSQHEEDWWRGISLRPKFYVMDSDKLSNYFEKVKEKFNEINRDAKLDKLNEKKHTDIINKFLPLTARVIEMIQETFENSSNLFNKTSILSKAEWSNVLQNKNMCRGIQRELNKNEVALKSYRSIDFDTILQVAQKIGTPQNLLQAISTFRGIVFEEILVSEEEYKRESNKLSLIESLQTLQKLAGTIFNLQVNIVFLSLTKYLTRNTPKYADFYYSKFNGSLEDLQYTRPMIEYCNKYLEEGWAKKAMDAVNAQEVLVDQFGIQLKNKSTTQILKALTSIQ